MSFAIRQKSKLNCQVTCTGDAAYQAPEVYNSWGYTSKVDIWGLGMTTYAMIAGRVSGTYVAAAFSPKFGLALS